MFRCLRFLLCCICLTLPMAFAVHSKAIPAGWMRSHRADGAVSMKFILAVKQQNLDVLESKFWSVSDPKSPDYRHFMSIEDISALIAPSSTDMGIITDWLLLSGVCAHQIHSFGDALEIATNVSVAERLFQTEIYKFQHETSRKSVLRQFGGYFLPATVSSRIQLIVGLSNFPPAQRRSHLRHPPVTAFDKSNAKGHRLQDSPFAVVPQSVDAMYNVTAQTIGNIADVSSQGVIEFDSLSYSPDALQQYAKLVGIPITPLSTDHVIGTLDPQNVYPSVDADVQLLTALNTHAATWFWVEDSGVWLYGFALHFFATTDVPQLISIGYGWYEGQVCNMDPDSCNELGVDSDGYVARVNVELQKIALRGVSILASSGNGGAHTIIDELCTSPTLLVDFPSSSPYVTSVGATQVSVSEGVPLASQPQICTDAGISCLGGGTEVATDPNMAFMSSGGGFSEVADQPSYQSAAVAAYLSSGVTLPPASYYNASRRATPDVSALGPFVLTYSQETISLLDYTSMAVDHFAAVMSLLNQAAIAKSGKPLGFLNPLLYQIAAEVPNAFQDITNGDNICVLAAGDCPDTCTGYYAAKGWDPVTGLGSPNYGLLLTYINTHFI